MWDRSHPSSRPVRWCRSVERVHLSRLAFPRRVVCCSPGQGAHRALDVSQAGCPSELGSRPTSVALDHSRRRRLIARSSVASPLRASHSNSAPYTSPFCLVRPLPFRHGCSVSRRQIAGMPTGTQPSDDPSGSWPAATCRTTLDPTQLGPLRVDLIDVDARRRPEARGQRPSAEPGRHVDDGLAGR